MRRRRFTILIAALALLAVAGLIVRTGGVAAPLEPVMVSAKEVPFSGTVDARFHPVEVDPPAARASP